LATYAPPEFEIYDVENCNADQGFLQLIRAACFRRFNDQAQKLGAVRRFWRKARLRQSVADLKSTVLRTSHLPMPTTLTQRPV